MSATIRLLGHGQSGFDHEAPGKFQKSGKSADPDALQVFADIHRLFVWAGQFAVGTHIRRWHLVVAQDRARCRHGAVAARRGADEPALAALGGFLDMPLMEDVELSKRLPNRSRRGRLVKQSGHAPCPRKRARHWLIIFAFHPFVMIIERLSIELTNRCNKTCDFCYNHSGPDGETLWNAADVVGMVRDCVRHGVKAVSFGGGEPLLFPGLAEVLEALKGQVFRSITTNGLALTDAEQFARLVAVRLEKVHVSIHRPAAMPEVRRVIATVQELESAGIASGVNLLVSADQIESASRAAQMLRDEGIDNQRIVYIPQRGANTPTAKAVATVAGGPFQSMSCLTSCGSSPRFCSISWDRAAAWCSYTSARQRLPSLSYSGLVAALAGLGVVNCVDKRAMRWRE